MMCGINGYYDFNKKQNRDELLKIVHTMNNKIIYRGPDGEGIFVNDNFAMGMRRLSIIDLSTGNQPIFNEKGNLAIIFNGEIYNYREIKSELQIKGHVFSTSSDTEVIVHLFEEEGYDCIKRLDGMFAFAIYNKDDGELFIGRDCCGEKPLYYYIDKQKFIFASELKSIIAVKAFKKDISKIGLEFYLKFGYIPAPYTIFDEVYKLEAGFYMVIKNDQIVEKAQYWDMKIDDNILINNHNKCVIELKNRLTASIKSRMVSDVPVGCFLSGGIDSTIITGLMSKISDKPVEAFTIGFEDKAYDETDRAIIAAKAFGCRHHIEILTPKNMIRCAEAVIQGMDEPFADPAAIPTFFLSQMAAKHVKVILTGESGDELFAGYNKYLICYYSNLYNKLPKVLRYIIPKLLRMLSKQSTVYRKINKVISNSEKDLFNQRISLMQVSASDEVYKAIVNDTYQSEKTTYLIRTFYEKYSEMTKSEMARVLYTDFKVLLEGCMFPKVDRVSMLNSIETRTPMVAKDILNLSVRIPSQFKINSHEQKIILKEAFKDIIPPTLLYKSKRGFSVPLGKWFKKELKEELEMTLENACRNSKLFRREAIKKLIQDHQNDYSDNARILWSLYIFEKWYERYFLGSLQ